MKIVEDSPSRLVIEDRPWFLGIVLIGCILIALGVLIQEGAKGRWGIVLLMVLLGLGCWELFRRYLRFSRLTLDTKTGEAIFESRTLQRADQTRIPIKELRRAVIEENRDGDGVARRVTLVFNGGRPPLPLTNYFSGVGSFKEVETKINCLIGTPSTGG